MTTVICKADMVVAWDAATDTHVYMQDADVAFDGGVLSFVGAATMGRPTRWCPARA